MKLHDYIKLKNLTQRQMAKILNVSPPTMCYYLKGKRYPSAEVIKRIFTITKGAVSANDFYGCEIGNLSKDKISNDKLADCEFLTS